MPITDLKEYTGDEDDEPKPNSRGGYTEFECPSCNANNPVPDGFKAGEEVLCNYCGAEFDVLDRGDGRVKLKER
ncbi:MAG: hypothetical protein HY904_09050 [Deltaproteobacteria bacterium]|nr:hypothetical protein [Deltaproteobacteria bacterium]